MQMGLNKAAFTRQYNKKHMFEIPIVAIQIN